MDDEVIINFVANTAELVDRMNDMIRLEEEVALATREVKDKLDSIGDAVGGIATAVDALRDFAASASKAGGASGSAAAAVGHLRDASVTLSGIMDELALHTDFLAASEDHLRDISGTLGLALREVRDSAAELMIQTTVLADSLAVLQKMERSAADSSLDLMAQTRILADGFASLDHQLDAVIVHLGLLTAAQGAAAGAAARGAAANNAAAAATNKVASAQKYGHGWLRLTAMGWHWLATAVVEYLAVAVPGTLALGAGLAVMAQGAIRAFNYSKELYEVIQGTSATFGDTTNKVLGLSGAFQKAATAADPAVYGALGSALDIVRERSGGLAAAGLQVAQVFNTFMARMAFDFSSSGPFGKSGGLMQQGVIDLTEFGQVIGNVSHAIDSLAGKMPGIAELLLKIATAASQVVVWIAQLSPGLIQTFVIFHEFEMWGGLAVAMLLKFGLATERLTGSTLSPARALSILSALFKALPLGIAAAIQGLGNLRAGFGMLGPGAAQAGAKIRNFGEDMESSIVALPVWQAALGAVAAGGLAYLIYKLVTAKSATQQFTDALQRNVEKASDLKIYGTIESNMSKLTSAENQTRQQLDSMTKSADQNSVAIGSVTKGYGRVSSVAGQLQAKLDQLSKGMQQQIQDAAQVTLGANEIAKKYGISVPAAMQLAQMANVNLSKSIMNQKGQWTALGEKINGLMTTYGVMGQTTGAVATTMEAVQIQAGLSATKISTLNQALDTFEGNATGLTSTFATFAQNITEIGNNGVKAGASFKIFNGTMVSTVQSTAKELRSFEGTGAQVWQNYDSALSSAQQYTDQLRVSSAYGIITQKAFTQQIAYSVQQLLPYAQYSKTAVAELSAIAQQAGGPATSSFKSLESWTMKNTESTKQFNKQTQDETIALSNAAQMASQFAGTLNQDVIGALTKATVDTAQVTQNAQNFDEAWRNASGTLSGPVRASLSQLFTSLYSVTHNTGVARKYVDDYARQLGATSGQIKSINSYLDVLAKKLSNVSRTYTTDIVVNGEITASGKSALAAAGVPSVEIAHIRQAEGGLISGPGTSRSDSVPAHLSAGEFVMQAAAVQKYGTAFMHAVNKQKLADGGLVMPASGTGGVASSAAPIQLNIHIDSYLDGAKVNSTTRTQTLIYNRRNPSNNLSLRVR